MVNLWRVFSNYADDIKSDKNFDKYKPWHYLNMELDDNYKDIILNKKGDVVQAINYCINILKDKNKSKKEKIFYLKTFSSFCWRYSSTSSCGKG